MHVPKFKQKIELQLLFSTKGEICGNTEVGVFYLFMFLSEILFTFLQLALVKSTDVLRSPGLQLNWMTQKCFQTPRLGCKL